MPTGVGKYLKEKHVTKIHSKTIPMLFKKHLPRKKNQKEKNHIWKFTGYREQNWNKVTFIFFKFGGNSPLTPIFMSPVRAAKNREHRELPCHGKSSAGRGWEARPFQAFFTSQSKSNIVPTGVFKVHKATIEAKT